MQLGDIKIGKTARIVKLHPGNVLYRNRLISMGLLPGTELTVSRVAPLGDPIEITVRGFSLSLRKGEASILQLEEVTP